MKRTITIAITLILVVIFIFSMFGCDAFSVNEEKDAQTVIATINGVDILKSEYLEYLDFNLILYSINDYSVPTEGDEYEALKEDIFNDFIANLTYRTEAQALGLETDETTISESVTEMMLQTRDYFADDATFDTFLSDYDLTQETYEALVRKELTLLSWSNLYEDYEDNDYSVVTEKTAVTVDDVQLPNYLLYYFVITDELYTYMNEGTYPEDAEDLLAFFDSEIVLLSNAQTLIAYAEENGIEVTQEEIAEQLAMVDYIADYFGEDTMQYLYESYYMTEEQIDSAKTFMGTAYAISNKIQKDTIAAIAPTDKELKEYYEDNADDYDESSASVYHIVTTDKTVAKKLEDEAGGTGEGFMAVYEKYKDDETISEAAQYTDLTKLTNFVPEFLDAVFDADEGEVVGMVQTTYGYHIIYVYEKNDVPLPELNDIKDQVTEDYITDNQNSIVSETLQEIYDSAKVKQGDYRLLAEDALIQALQEKYNVDTDLKAALR